jgi:predicted dehydrogenase
MNKNKIAIIGAGYWGSIIVNALINLKFNNIVVHDTNIKNLNILKKKFNKINIQRELLNILKDKNIKNIIVATPPSKNYELVKKLILNKKDVFLEKPGFKNIREISLIQKLLTKSKSKLMFGYIYCYNNQIDAIKKILNKKKLGKILYISFSRKNLGPIRNDVDVDYDLTSHDLSIIMKIFGKLPKIISYKKYYILNKNIADISNLHLKLNKIHIDINNSWLNPTKERLIKIIGTQKMLLYNEQDKANPIKIYNQYAKYPKLDFFNKKFLNSKALVYKGNNAPVKIKSNNPLLTEIKYFLNKKRFYTDINFSKKILNFLKGI